jgi:hypothetical protein
LPSKAQDVTTQTHSISDDGYANVPLQFDFPYYGQTFNNSWMFSNGVISFRDPQESGLSMYNLSVQPMSSTMGSQFDYSIFPLWTDLINISGTFKTEGSTSFQRYSWIGISPFYNGNRLNTFSVEITPDGKVVTNYSLLNIDYGQVGLTGKTSSGEFESISSLGQTTSLSGWDRITEGYVPPPPDPCSSNPLSSPSCPGYTQALLSSLPSTSTTNEISPITTTTTTPEPEVVQSTPIVQQPIAQTPTETAPTETVASTSVTTESQSSGGSKVSLSTILSIVGNEQSRIAGVERSTVEQSVEQSVREGEKATQQAESIAANATSESISVSISSAQSQMALEQQQANSSAQSSGGGLNFFSSGSGSLSPFDSSVGLKVPEPTISEQLELVQSEKPKLSVQPEQFASIQTEEKTESAVSFSGFSAVNVLKEEETKTDSGVQTEQKTETVKRNVPNNELAGDVTLASLGATPQGFQAYSIGMPDSSFYAPKEIYRNQRTVDNPAGRRLFDGSDRMHQEMIDQQYKGN